MRRTLAALVLGFVGACFDAPNEAVMFSCDPEDAPACPSGYTCESDGCCHRDGSDVDANLGGCKLTPDPGATTISTSIGTESGSSGTGSGSESSAGTSETGSSSGSESSSSSGSESSSSSGSDSSSSGAESSSSSAAESSSSSGDGSSSSSGA